MNDNAALLLVDDRPENLTALKAVLADEGADLVTASSGNEALSLTLKRDFALVLLDVQMPDMDGFETAELIRANPKTRHLPVIFVTAGLNDTKLQFKGYELGAVDYLIKPFEPQLLRSKARVFCDLYRQRRQLESVQVLLELKISERVAQLRESEERFRFLATPLTGGHLPARRRRSMHVRESLLVRDGGPQRTGSGGTGMDAHRAQGRSPHGCGRVAPERRRRSVRRPSSIASSTGTEGSCG